MLRISLIALAIPIGLATGLGALMAAGGAEARLDKVAALEADVRALGAPRAARRLAGPSLAADISASPLFILTVGPGAVSEPVVRLDGVSVNRRRSAALLSIGGGPAEWMNVGEARAGVALEQVLGSRVVIDTLLGRREIALGEQIGSASPGPAAEPARSDVLPLGVRAPLPPASAPGVR